MRTGETAGCRGMPHERGFRGGSDWISRMRRRKHFVRNCGQCFGGHGLCSHEKTLAQIEAGVLEKRKEMKLCI